jgi:hypothetical protein
MFFSQPRPRIAYRRIAAWAALALALTSGSASAATYYLSPSGSDSNAGTSPGSPWATINKANTALRAGDVVIIGNGTYTQQINPTTNGTSSGRITYVGNLASPTSVQVSGVDLSKAYITVKGISTGSGGGLVLGYLNESAKAFRDSVAFCYFRGSVAFRGAKNCMVARNTFLGGVAFEMDHGLAGFPATANSAFDTLRRNVINNGTITWKGFVVRGYTERCVVDSNQISGSFTGSNTDVQGRYFYRSYNNILRDNKWTYEATNNAGGPWVAFAFRDSSSFNLFERDTVLAGVQSGYLIGGRLVNAGDATIVGGCHSNIYRGCFYKTTSYVWAQDNFTNGTIENSVFASKTDYAVWFLGDVINSKIRNNTFYSARNRPVRFEGDIRAGTTEIFNNVFYCDAVTNCGSGGGLLVHGRTSGFTENNNLFFAASYPGVTDPASMSILFGQCSRPGVGQPWYNATGMDGQSKWASPRFADSTFANFDPHLRAGSYAIGMGQNGVDVGAYPYGTGGTDQTAPAAVTNLAAIQIADNSVILGWTAPGDDGSSGTATSYDLRYSLAPIDAGNFAAATAFPIQPFPSAGGTSQTYVALNLTPNTNYYFAIKARDENNNVAAISNVVLARTLSVDQVAPSAIQDLSTQP